MKTILEAIKSADEVEVDAMFSVLKYRSIGILRKLKCMALILDLDEDVVLAEAPKDNQNRILDHESRHAICDALIVTANKYHKKQ